MSHSTPFQKTCQYFSENKFFINLNFLLFIQMLDENHISKYQHHSPILLAKMKLKKAGISRSGARK
jgi:hypothetical protein